MATFPPFHPFAATSAVDWSTHAGAERLAEMIRAAWASVGVPVKVEVFPVSNRRREVVSYTARLDMPGGLPACADAASLLLSRFQRK